jgi:ABC-type branched-subunit amino acid transport system substrate-binding protein
VAATLAAEDGMIRKLLRLTPLAAAIVLASTISIGNQFHIERFDRTRTIDAATGPVANGGGPTGGPASDPTKGLVNAPLPASKPGLACARGRNGGATDVGVTATSIKLGATVVKSGIGASFLKEVPIALEAVKNKVNRAGGICGRLLDLAMVDDGWNAARGQQFIGNFIAQGKFALAVSPSSEGLDAAIRSGDIQRAGIPVVGADGMLISQYQSSWVWPVAASTMTTMHLMAKEAAQPVIPGQRAAKTFGLVYDTTYHFGAEGAAAFRGALRRLFGGQKVLLADVGIDADKGSYKVEVDEFNRACNRCDFVAMLLEPQTALQWIRDGGSFGSVKTGGPQPLFVDSFARSCGAPCNGMWVWTGYRPPVAPFDDDPAVVRYVNDVRAQRSTVDTSNPFVQGGYLGMQLLVKGLEAVGPELTRKRLQAALDRTLFDTGLSVPLRWSAGRHFANNSAHAFSIVINSGSFAGWRYEQTGWVADPWIGMDAPKR